MKIDDSQCHHRIILATSKLLASTQSDKLRIADVAEESHVSVPTIYYHFSTRQSLISEAQAFSYFLLSEPLRESLSNAELAVFVGDETAFWKIVSRHILLAWSSGKSLDGQNVVKMLRDVRADPKTRLGFDATVNEHFARWVRLFEESQSLGWSSKEVDFGALVASFWAASVGQSIVGNASLTGISPERIRDLFLRIAIVRRKVQD
jgi:AcrR family transcriptional regulator